MQSHKIITPGFYSQFSCRGSDCIDNCCHSWSINIDKKTHKKYEKSPHARIRQLAKENLIPTREGKAHYSVVRLNEQGDCPFLDGKGLCLIHTNMGAQALSHTCISFPRLKNSYTDQTNHSMTLACSEVARLVLFKPDSMLLAEKHHLLANANNNNTYHPNYRNQRSQLINLLFSHLALAQSQHVEDNLFAMINLILYLQKIDFAVEDHFPAVENFYNSLLTAITSGEMRNRQHHTESHAAIKIAVLTLLGSAISETRRGANYLLNNHTNIARFLETEKTTDENHLTEKFSVINKQWYKLCEASCLAPPHVLRNFIMYHLYNRDFPGNDLSTLFHQFYRLIIDYFYLKTSLTVMSFNKTIEEKDVMLLVSYYHIIYEHNKKLNASLNVQIKDIHFNDYLSCLLLLN